MKVINTKFNGLKIIQQKKHGDSRGNLRETFRKKVIKWDDLIFHYATTSKGNVLRGFHFQSKFKQAKFVSVLKGRILDCSYGAALKLGFVNEGTTKVKIEVIEWGDNKYMKHLD